MHLCFLHLIVTCFLLSAISVVYSEESHPLVSGKLITELYSAAYSHDVRAWITECRRHLHRHPELSFEEHDTSSFLRQQLDMLSIPYKHPFGTTGISALIGSGSPPTIALRADMDALPVQEAEEMDMPWRSQVDGKMHACGHDAHMAMLLGAARLLKECEGSLPGSVVVLFQPAEEGGGGARRMISEGALQGAEAVAGLHVWPGLPTGTIATRTGTIMAASDRFTFSVNGKGGHGALPHLASDPVVAASAIVMALQTLVSRETSPTDGAVVTVSRFNTGPGALNVIPDSVQLQGTIRALTEETFERLHRRLEEVATGTAAAYGCSISSIAWSAVPYPPTRNDAQLALLVRDVALQLQQHGNSHINDAPVFQLLEEPSMAAEDFSFYGQQVPSIFTFLGIGKDTLGTTASLHNPSFQMDEGQMPLGAALHAVIAIEYLSRQAHQQQSGSSSSSSSSSSITHEEL